MDGPRTTDLLLCLLIALAATSCKNCRSPGSDETAGHEPAGVATPADASEQEEVDPSSSLPAVDPRTLGLASADPSQPALKAMMVMDARKSIMAGDYEDAEKSLEAILETHPEHLPARQLLAGLQARTQRPGEATGTLERLLAAALPLYDQEVHDDPSVDVLRQEYEEHYGQYEDTREAIRLAWAETLSSDGAFVLVAPPFDSAAVGDPEKERLSRGWVVFVSASTGRFLPLTRPGSVAGFLLDRALKRMYVLCWKTYTRASKDGDETVRPALMNGVTVSYVDLRSLQTGPRVELGDGLASVRLSARSSLLLLDLERVDPQGGQPESSNLKVIWSDETAEPAPEAPPGPMDLVVRHGQLEPPGPPPGSPAVDPDGLPTGWGCVQAGDQARICSAPNAPGSVLGDILLVAGEGPSVPPEPLTKGVGVIMMDVL